MGVIVSFSSARLLTSKSTAFLNKEVFGILLLLVNEGMDRMSLLIAT